jgi:hypothetical protein
MSKNRPGIYCWGFFYCLFRRPLPRKAKERTRKNCTAHILPPLLRSTNYLADMEETNFLDTLTGKESIKVEHIVTTPISTIIYIVAGVALARVVSSLFDK